MLGLDLIGATTTTEDSRGPTWVVLGILGVFALGAGYVLLSGGSHATLHASRGAGRR